MGEDGLGESLDQFKTSKAWQVREASSGVMNVKAFGTLFQRFLRQAFHRKRVVIKKQGNSIVQFIVKKWLFFTIATVIPQKGVIIDDKGFHDVTVLVSDERYVPEAQNLQGIIKSKNIKIKVDIGGVK